MSLSPQSLYVCHPSRSPEAPVGSLDALLPSGPRPTCPVSDRCLESTDALEEEAVRSRPPARSPPPTAIGYVAGFVLGGAFFYHGLPSPAPGGACDWA